jgi:hypothetical protein
MLDTVARIADVFGLVLFLALSIYFFQLEQRSLIETTLMLSCAAAVVIDGLFVYDYFVNDSICARQMGHCCN